MIFALLMMLISGREDALRMTVREGMSAMYARLHGMPDILAQTRQPDAEIVDAMRDVVPDEALRAELSAETPSMSLRSIVKMGGHLTTPAEVDSVIQGTTGEERLARFNKRYPFGLLVFSAPGAKPFVTWQWMRARVDTHGDFQLRTAEIHLIELARTGYGWKIESERSVGIDW